MLGDYVILSGRMWVYRRMDMKRQVEKESGSARRVAFAISCELLESQKMRQGAGWVRSGASGGRAPFEGAFAFPVPNGDWRSVDALMPSMRPLGRSFGFMRCCSKYNDWIRAFEKGWACR